MIQNGSIGIVYLFERLEGDSGIENIIARITVCASKPAIDIAVEKQSG